MSQTALRDEPRTALPPGKIFQLDTPRTACLGRGPHRDTPLPPPPPLPLPPPPALNTGRSSHLMTRNERPPSSRATRPDAPHRPCAAACPWDGLHRRRGARVGRRRRHAGGCGGTGGRGGAGEDGGRGRGGDGDGDGDGELDVGVEVEPGAEVVSRVEDGEEGVDVHCPRARAAGVKSGRVRSGERRRGEEGRGGEGGLTRATRYAEYVDDERALLDPARVLRVHAP